ncbi:MAG: tetratricopeptide repeat protein [Deltaproteobacteria bacterium]|nr:tetratricopeptide repeat protein [Deltaproteobacteria bacterium]
MHLVGRRRRYEEALRYARFAEAALARIGSPPQTVARLLASRGTVLVATGRTEEGLAEYQAARAIDVELYGEGDQAGLATVQHIGAAQTRLRRYAEAEKTFAQGLAYATEAVGTQHPTTARFAMSYGGILAQLRRYDEARPHFEAGLATRQAVLSRDDPELAAAHRAFAVFESNQGRYAQADEHLAAAVTVLDRREPPDADELVSTLVERCSTRYRLGEIDEAWDHCLRARTVAEAQPRPEPVGHFTSVNRLAIIAKRRGEPESAHALRVQAITIGEQAWGPSNARLADPLLGAASIDIEQGRAEAAVPRLRRAAELRRADGTAHGQLPYNHLLLARALAEREPAQAQTHAQQAWRLAEEGGNADVRTLTAAWLRERALPLPQ